ncbi:hypothetical protein GS876_23455 [Rhodococcus hoagii]|nr:hypothetical protein [Prescottella equi]
MREMADEFIGEFFGNWLSGNYTPFDTFQDAQRSVEWRLNELEKVSGYCNLVMSKNWNVNGGGLNGYARAIPFDTPMGPKPKNASPFKGLFHGSGTSDTASSSRSRAHGGWTRRSPQTAEEVWTRASLHRSTYLLGQGHPDPVLGTAFRRHARVHQGLEHHLPHNRCSSVTRRKIVVCVSFAHGQGRWMVLGGDRWSG